MWRDRLGLDDLHVLTLAIEVAIALRLDGHAADARQLTLDTLARLREHYGDEHEVALLCANNYGADLRDRGQFGRRWNWTGACCQNSSLSSARIISGP